MGTLHYCPHLFGRRQQNENFTTGDAWLKVKAGNLNFSNQKFRVLTMQPPTKRKSGLTKPMKLSDDLADIVGKKEASRAECVKVLWAYIKEKDLQDPKNKQYFKPDKKLAKIFGTDRIRGFGMVKFLKTHVTEK